MGEIRRKRPWEETTDMIESNGSFGGHLIICIFLIGVIIYIKDTSQGKNITQYVHAQIMKTINIDEVYAVFNEMKEKIETYDE